MQTLLLTGASGFLGQRFANLFSQKYNIVGLVHTNQNNSSIKTHNIDLTNQSELTALINEIKPNIILHTAAISSIAACQADIDYSTAVNIKTTSLLAKKANQLGAQFIFTSTDLVFDGVKGNYLETDGPNPLNIYGQLKWEAEKQITEIYSDALITRLPLMVGPNAASNRGVIADLINSAKTGKTVNLFTDEYRTPLHVNQVAHAIDFLIQKKATGIYHISGANKYSRHQLGIHLKEKYNLENVVINQTTHAACNITNRPKDVSMSTTKLQQLGFVINSNL